MTTLRRSEPISREYIERLLEGAAPERLEEMKKLWAEYNPQFFLADDGPGVQMSALDNCITFDNKTLRIYWLLSFAGWKTVKCYSPAVLGSISGASLIGRRDIVSCIMGRLLRAGMPPGTTIANVIQADNGLATVENRFQEYVYNARTLLRSDQFDKALWPAEVPLPGTPREHLKERQDQITFDFACMSTAYAFCHEMRHVMYAKKQDAPERPQEELECDMWARAFLTDKTEVYAKSHGHNPEHVLSKRSMASAIGVFVLYETSERLGDKGTESYPPIADRINATLRGTPLPASDHFWIVYASVLVAILRRRNHTPAVTATNAIELCDRLVEEVRRTS